MSSLSQCLFVCFHTRSPDAGIIGSQGEFTDLEIQGNFRVQQSKNPRKIVSNCHNPTQLNPKLGRPYFPKKPQSPQPPQPPKPFVTFSQLLPNQNLPNSVFNLISTRIVIPKKIGHMTPCQNPPPHKKIRKYPHLNLTQL